MWAIECAQPRIKNVPWSTPTCNYTVQSDVVYGQGEVFGGGIFFDMKLDLYIPDIPPPMNGSNIMPLMLQNPVPSSRVQALYDYFGGANAITRDRTRAAAIDDTLTALDFLHARSDVHEPWTTIWGNSAGGNTALGAVYALDDHGITRPPVAVVLEISGRIEDANVGNPFDSPLVGDPVLMSITGTDDHLYPFLQETETWAINAGLPFDFQEITNGGHSPDMFTNNASTGVSLFQRTVDWHHETIFFGLVPGEQAAPPGC